MNTIDNRQSTIQFPCPHSLTFDSDTAELSKRVVKELRRCAVSNVDWGKDKAKDKVIELGHELLKHRLIRETTHKR
jgi:hypothetical protein